MDTGTHLRAIWRRRWAVLAPAVVVALVVLVLRATAPTLYAAQADLFLVPGGTSSDEPLELERLSAFYVEIVSDPRIVADLQRRSGLTLSAEELDDALEVSAPEDTLITVVARQPTAARAAALADATAEALGGGAAADQAEAQKVELEPLDAELADLAAQLAALEPGDPQREALVARQERAVQARVDRLSQPRARLDLVRRADPDDAVRQPQPLRDAALAFLLTLIVAAEVAALLAARHRGLEGRDPSPVLEAWTGLPAFRLGDGRHGADQTAAAMVFLEQRTRGSSLFVAPVKAGPDADGTAALLAARMRRNGEVVWVRLTEDPDARQAPDGVRVRRAVLPAPRTADLVSTAAGWQDAALLQAAAAQPGPLVLLVQAENADQRSVQEAVRVLSHTGTPAVAVLVTETGGAADDDEREQEVPAPKRAKVRA